MIPEAKLDEWQAVDTILYRFGEWLSDGDYGLANLAIKTIDPDVYSRAEIAAVLTVTKGSAENLPALPEFYRKARESLIRRFDEPTTNRLLSGLEIEGGAE